MARWIERLDEAPFGLREPLIWIVSPSIETFAGLGAPPADRHDAAGLGPARGAGRLRRLALARRLIARCLGRHPQSVVFEREPSGRLAVRQPCRLFVSAAGCGAWSAVALARSPIGVDIAFHEPASALPADVLHPAEQSRLSALAPPQYARAWLRIWTAKEAYLKAAGLTLDQVAAIDLGDVAGAPTVGGREAAFRDFAGGVAAAVWM